jgi:purine-binding chemotaxis protein CheW
VNNQQIGLLVDEVSDILTTNEKDIQAAPDVSSELVRSFVRGLLSLDKRMISLISLDHLLAAPELEAA